MPGPRPGSTPCSPCPQQGVDTRPRPRPGSRDPAGTRRIWARTGPPTPAPARYLTRAWWHRSDDHRNSERPHVCRILAFGIYTRRTGKGRASDPWRCTRTAIAILAGRSARPARRSRCPAARIALRHLPHADQRVRPGPQHQLLQVPGHGQSPSCTAVKILPRSRRTCSSWTRQSTRPRRHHQRAALGSVHRRRPTCPSVPAFRSLSASKAHLPTSAPFRARHQAGIRPVIRGPAGRSPGPAAPVSCCLSAAGISLPGHPVPPGSSAPLTVGLPPRLRIPAPGRGP